MRIVVSARVLDGRRTHQRCVRACGLVTVAEMDRAVYNRAADFADPEEIRRGLAPLLRNRAYGLLGQFAGAAAGLLVNGGG